MMYRPVDHIVGPYIISLVGSLNLMLVQTISVVLYTLGFYHLVGYSLFGHMQNADQEMCDDNSTDNLTGH